MILGIVGHEAKKFTSITEDIARERIRDLIARHAATKVVSGACHLGGIDIWAIEEAKKIGLEWEEFQPEKLQWEPNGFKARNLKIAASSLVACVVVKDYPPDYDGMRFKSCYHCRTANQTHIKSGGCWTAWKCKAREWVII